ncbi:hypothetical protein [Providencia burhodogranariea]|uniref:hypothetical protein n=1 Tax=Providencia burhodogranariea TaxID=516074 RepID=UPI00191C17ED|nr:hypothetical protein [Providencia burhodogranariea]
MSRVTEIAPNTPIAKLTINNALVYLVRTPNNAGSVIPKIAVIPEPSVIENCFRDDSSVNLEHLEVQFYIDRSNYLTQNTRTPQNNHWF